MSLVLPSVKGSALSCSEYENNILFSLDLANATGSLDCSKISQSSLSTCLSANNVIIGIQEDIGDNATAIGEVSQDLTDAQTTLQGSINNLITLVGNQNTTIADLTAQIGVLTAAFNTLDSTVAAFNSRLLSVEGIVVSLEEAIALGIIVVWSGLVTAIPTNWILCNGTNGTPDLRDRFIVGAGGAYGVNTVGGTTSHSHFINGISADTSLTVDQLPSHGHGLSIGAHSHDFLMFWGGGAGGQTDSFDFGEGKGAVAAEGGQELLGGARRRIANTNGIGEQIIQSTNIGGTASNTGSNAGHNHGVNLPTDGVLNLPPYYALAYIMKI